MGILRKALAQAGFVGADFVRLCAEGRAALASNPYDAAILDLRVFRTVTASAC